MKNFYLMDLKAYKDERGSLMPFELNSNCPFDVKRAFIIYDVPSVNTERAGHTNQISKQVLVAIKGSVNIYVADEKTSETFILDSTEKGLYINNGVYKKIYNFSKDAILMCLCDTNFSEADYK